MDQVPALESLVGREVAMLVPILDDKRTIRAKVHRVESTGLWIESAEGTELLLKKASTTATPRTMVLFVPFSGIGFVVAFLDFPGL